MVSGTDGRTWILSRIGLVSQATPAARAQGMRQASATLETDVITLIVMATMVTGCEIVRRRGNSQ